MQEFFQQLAENYPKLNFVFFYDPVQASRVLDGIWMTVKLAVMCIIFSLIIGVTGAFFQTSKSRLLKGAMQGYIQFFSNTPPMVQLLFFYFPLGKFTPKN